MPREQWGNAGGVRGQRVPTVSVCLLAFPIAWFPVSRCVPVGPSLQEFWVMNTPIQSTIILLIEQIVVALGGEFKLYLPQLIPHMLRVFMHDNSQGRIVSIKVSTLGQFPEIASFPSCPRTPLGRCGTLL